MPSKSGRLVNGEAELEHLLGKVDEAVTMSRDAEAFFKWESLRPEAERPKRRNRRPIPQIAVGEIKPWASRTAGITQLRSGDRLNYPN